MGTRADFYVGRGEKAEWLGSIAWDGYPDGIDAALLAATNEADYRRLAAGFFKTREDYTAPSEGWPWPWDDSCTTDYAYAFDGDAVWASCFGGSWFEADDPASEGEKKEAVFPKMRTDKAHPYGSKKSGGILLVGK